MRFGRSPARAPRRAPLSHAFPCHFRFSTTASSSPLKFASHTCPSRIRKPTFASDEVNFFIFFPLFEFSFLFYRPQKERKEQVEDASAKPRRDKYAQRPLRYPDFIPFLILTSNPYWKHWRRCVNRELDDCACDSFGSAATGEEKMQPASKLLSLTLLVLMGTELTQVGL